MHLLMPNIFRQSGIPDCLFFLLSVEKATHKTALRISCFIFLSGKLSAATSFDSSFITQKVVFSPDGKTAKNILSNNSNCFVLLFYKLLQWYCCDFQFSYFKL